MKGVVIAGGIGSRLYPITKAVNKNLLAVYDKPLVYYPILTLRDAGVKEILIVSSKSHLEQFLNLLGKGGSHMGLKLSYVVEEKPMGIAHALSLAENFSAGDNIVCILGDNIIEDSISKSVNSFTLQSKCAKVFLKEVPDPRAFGVPRIENNLIVEIIEKPRNPPTNFAVTGVYIYDNRVFEIIRTLVPSARGELEITDLNNFYARERTLSYEIFKGEWIDAGTFDSLLRANNFVAENKDRLDQFKL